MTIEDIKNLKDKVYEIEGLLELAQLREDKIEELAPLIDARIKALATQEAGAAETTEATEAAEATEATGAVEATGATEKIEKAVTIEELFEESERISVTKADNAYNNFDASDSTGGTDSTDSSDSSSRTSSRVGSKPAFTLNDRFRFRRELFNNSDTQFSEAMGRIALMDSYDEAEEHFIGELGWNPENPEVVDFMEIIRIYFEG